MTALSDRLLALTDVERQAALAGLTAEELDALQYCWPVWARGDQLPPARDPAAAVPWRIWAMIAGRGAGKTRSAAEHVRMGVETGRRGSVAIIGPTADTLRRDVVQGESGLLSIAPPWCKPVHEPSQRRIVWPNGAVAYLLSSEEPDRIRGINADSFWGDELTSWNAPEDCWNNLQFALRIPGRKGDPTEGVISTTPKRHALLKSIMADPATVVTRASTFDNAANLDSGTLDYLRRKYEGTTIGRQELYAELMDDVEGALWNRDMLDRCLVASWPTDMKRIVVAIDPAGSSSSKSAETGIVMAGRGADGHGYVLADQSGRYTPDGWARRAVELFHANRADRIVAERNYGGEMVEATIRSINPNVPVKLVNASRGKAVRAEPVVSFYEQRRAHHVGNLLELEDQLCSWDPLGSDPSPDRLDALVWALSDLMVEPQAQPARSVRCNIMWR